MESATYRILFDLLRKQTASSTERPTARASGRVVMTDRMELVAAAVTRRNAQDQDLAGESTGRNILAVMRVITLLGTSR